MLYGALCTEPTPLPLMDVLIKSLTSRDDVLCEITGDPERIESPKRFIVEGLERGKLKPIVAKAFPFEQIAEAHRYMESNQQIGKTVVTVQARR